jgi:hypothetical protein
MATYSHRSSKGKIKSAICTLSLSAAVVVVVVGILSFSKMACASHHELL